MYLAAHSSNVRYTNRLITAQLITLGAAALTLLLSLRAHYSSVEYGDSFNTTPLIGLCAYLTACPSSAWLEGWVRRQLQYHSADRIGHICVYPTAFPSSAWFEGRVRRQLQYHSADRIGHICAYLTAFPNSV